MKKKWILAAIFLAISTVVFAQTDSNQRLDNVGQVLLILLVLSVVFEVAMTPIFNWSVFLKYFEGKGVKTPVTVVLAFIVFWSYDIDIVKDLLNSLNYDAQLTIGGQALTALLIAGGSDGIFRIFSKLGIRNPTERKRKAELLKASMESEKNQTASTDPKGD